MSVDSSSLHANNTQISVQCWEVIWHWSLQSIHSSLEPTHLFWIYSVIWVLQL